jgi:hypothetical protein
LANVIHAEAKEPYDAECLDKMLVDKLLKPLVLAVDEIGKTYHDQDDNKGNDKTPESQGCKETVILESIWLYILRDIQIQSSQSRHVNQIQT